MAHWLRDFEREVRCSRSFARAMDTQLSARFREQTGLDLSGFVLAPAIPDMYTIRNHALVGFVKADLVGSRLGFPVTIAWSDPSQQRLIRPTDEVTDTDVEFWWHVLPADEIKEEESRPPEAPFDPAQFSFAIDFRLKVWPHVRLAVVTDADEETLAEVMATAQKEWSAGAIHVVRTVQRVDDRTVIIEVDVGSAGGPGLEHILRRLAAAAEIHSIEVTSY